MTPDAMTSAADGESLEDDYNAMAAIRGAIGSNEVVIPSVFQLSDDLGLSHDRRVKVDFDLGRFDGHDETVARGPLESTKVRTFRATIQ